MSITADAALDTAIEAPLIYSVRTDVKPVSATGGPDGLMRSTVGTFSKHVMRIEDGRRRVSDFRLEEAGFELADHPTQVRDFFDPEQLRGVYHPEMERLIAERTGASRVFVFDHTLRSSDEHERAERKIREPVQRVHAINRPIERNPLALADARSIAFDDLIPAERRFPDRVGEIYMVEHNPAHRWTYFPRMRRDEAIVFKVYDSDAHRSRWTAHTSFEDPTTRADAPPRESIEIRAFAFF